MTSPVPYSKPKRLFFNKNRVKFRTRVGSYVYAPHGGKISSSGSIVRIVTNNGYEHRLKNVVLTKARQDSRVKAGVRIGEATGLRVVYSRYRPDGEEVDALQSVLRNDSSVVPPEFFSCAKRRIPVHQGGEMGPGTERKVVWHSSESNWQDGIDGVVDWIQKQGSQYTLLWNPYEKDRRKRFVQLYSSRVGARALKNDGDYPTNRHGELCIQICVIGRKSDTPLSKSPMYGRRELMEWLDFHKIPRKLIFDQTAPIRSRSQWGTSGHATHRTCPGNDHTDPGYINISKLFGP